MNLVKVLRHSECEVSRVPAGLLCEACHGRSSQTPMQTPAETNALTSKPQQQRETLPSPDKGTVCEFFIPWPQEDMEEWAGVLLFPQDLCVVLLWAVLWMLAQDKLLSCWPVAAAAILHWEHDSIAAIRVLCQESCITCAVRSKISINLRVSSNGICVVRGDEALLPWSWEPAQKGFLLCEGLITKVQSVW